MMDINEFWCILWAFLVLVITKSSADGDLCEPNPCKNNGICIYVNKEINCICEDHLIGSRCETDPCEPNPCKHGGQCETAVNKFSCSCSGLYTGETCERVLDICQNNPCKNEGRCHLENGQYQCDCKKPYTGKICDQITKNEGEESSSYKPSSPVTITMNIIISTKSKYLEATATETILPNVTLSTIGVPHITTNSDEESSSQETSSHETTMTNVVKFTSSEPASSEVPTTKTFDPNIAVSALEILNTSTIITDPTISDEESSSQETSNPEMTTTNPKFSTDPESSKEGTTKEIKPGIKISTEISERNTKITVSKSNVVESGFTELASPRTTTMNLVKTSGDIKTIMTRTLGPNIASTTMEQSSMFTTSTVSSIMDKNEIPKKFALPKAAAYACGTIGSGLGLFLLVAGIVHFSKRSKTKEQMLSFKNADSTSIVSANSGSNLV